MKKALFTVAALLLLGTVPLAVRAQSSGMYSTPEKDPQWMATHLMLMQDSADRGLLSKADFERRRKVMYKKAGMEERETPHLERFPSYCT